MLSQSLALALIAAPLALGQSAAVDRDLSNMDASFRVGCPNTMHIEPIVIYNVSGATLLGPEQFQMTIYSNGLASFTRFAGGGLQQGDLQQTGPEGAGPGEPPSTIGIATTVNLSINEANQLASDLRRAGAQTLCDQEVYVTDVPLQTLTILEARSDAIAHTFSYWTGAGQYSDVAVVMDNFVEAYFPGL